MRKPDAETYELGHWESMTIQRALTDLAQFNRNVNVPELVSEEQVQHMEELAKIFALGTHTVTRKV